MDLSLHCDLKTLEELKNNNQSNRPLLIVPEYMTIELLLLSLLIHSLLFFFPKIKRLKELGRHSWGYTQKTVTQVTPEAPAHPCLLWHYSQ
jgi:hypothetical protein